MKRLCFGFAVVAVLVLTFALGGYAATKTYQFTGVVKTVDASTFSVEKNAKETWTFERASDTKGTPKLGDRVTVSYKMVATDIEVKPATATRKK
ncbi:MAG: hypothetical protein ACM3SQ_15570 [Betaproteobacteria bacterium]